MRRLLLLALLVIAPLALSPTSAQGQVTDTDVETVSVSPGDPAVGALRPVEATVRNGGPGTALEVTVTFYWGDTSNPLNGSEEDSQSQAGPLAAGDKATVQLDWSPSQARAGEGTLIAVANVTQGGEDPNPENNRDEAAAFVTDPRVRAAPAWGPEPIHVQPGAEHPLQLEITNRGNAEGTFVTEATQTEETNWTLRTSPAEVVLAPGEGTTVTITAQPPPEARGGDALNATTGLEIDVSMDGYENASDGHVSPSAPDLRVAEQRGLEVEVTEPEARKPGTLATGNLTVENIGNIDEHVTLSWDLEPGDPSGEWNLTFAADPAELAPGDRFETPYQVDLPRNATAGETVFVVRANGTGGEAPPVATAPLPVSVIQVHRVNVTVAEDQVALLPDEATQIQVAATNTGNGEDTVRFEAEAPSAAWTAKLRPDEVTLAPGASDTVELTLRPPSGHEPSEGLTTKLGFSTLGGEDAAQGQTSVEVDVRSGPYLRYRGLPAEVKIDPDGGASLRLSLANGGNEDGTVDLGFETPDGWSLFPSTRQATLEPAAEEPVELTVEAPAAAQPGDIATVGLEIDHRAGFTVTQGFPMVVGGPDLAVTLEPVPSRVPQGEVRNLTVHATNQGMKPAAPSNLTLTVEGAGGSGTLASWRLPALDPGEGVTRTTTWDTDGWSGGVLLAARTDADGELVEEREENNEATHPSFVTTVDIEVSEPPPATVDPGQIVRRSGPPLVFQVANRGNAPASVAVHVHDDGGWIDEETQLTLDANEARAVPVELRVPRPTERLANNVTLTATPTSIDGPSVQATWSLSVRDLAPPRLLTLNLSEEPRWGVPATHGIAFDDGTGVADGLVVVHGPNGTTEELAVDTDGDQPRFRWTPSTLGTHELEVRLEDLAGNIAPSPRQPVNVTPPPPPTVALEDPRPVQPGTLVQLNVSSAAPVDEVTLEGPLGSRAVPAPYRVNTAGWEEGAHAVDLTVTDTLGATGSATVEVTVDATPPVLTSVVTSPEDPSPGDRVTVRATFEEPIDHASVLFVLEDGVRIKEDLSASSPKTFEGSFQIPSEPTRRVDLQATDMAGNAELYEAAIDLDTGSLIPGPGLLAGLAALATAAVGFRRRG